MFNSPIGPGGNPFPGMGPLPGGPGAMPPGGPGGSGGMQPPPPPGFGRDSFSFGGGNASNLSLQGRPAPGTPGYDASKDEHVNNNDDPFGGRPAPGTPGYDASKDEHVNGEDGDDGDDPFGGRPAPGTPGYDASKDEHVNGNNDADNDAASQSLKDLLTRLLAQFN